VRYATATHYHGDHTENFELLAREVPEATLFVPHRQRIRLATGAVVHGERPLAPQALPRLTFEETLTLRLNGETIDVMTLPHRRGHTDGDAVVYFHEAEVLYVGDYLFLDRYPIIDASGDLEGYLANIEFLLDRFPDDTIVVPGHGTFFPEPLTTATMDRFRENLDALRRSITLVRTRLEQGESVEEIVKRGLPQELRPYGERPRYLSEERWIRFVADYFAPRVAG
jgi:cyclase